MARRQTIEQRIFTWFEEAPLEKAELLLALVAGRVKARRGPIAKKVLNRKKVENQAQQLGREVLAQ